MKITLEFDTNKEDGNEEAKTAISAINIDRYNSAIWDISQDIFRPARKHGYPNKELQDLLKKDGVTETIEILEKMFFDILHDNEIRLD